MLIYPHKKFPSSQLMQICKRNYHFKYGKVPLTCKLFNVGNNKCQLLNSGGYTGYN